MTLTPNNSYKLYRKYVISQKYFVLFFHSRTAYMKKEHEESTKTAESKSYVKKLSEISTDISTQIEKLTITKTDDQNSAKETSVPVAIPVVSDREIFIPSEYAICGESPRVNTISLSNQFLSRPQVTKTTDSKEQKWYTNPWRKNGGNTNIIYFIPFLT